MAATPPYKVYGSNGVYQAACKEAEAAVVLAEFYGHKATVRLGHTRVVFTHGVDGEASKSIDEAVRALYSHIPTRPRS